MDPASRETPPLQARELHETRPLEFSGHAGACIFDVLTLLLVGLFVGIIGGGVAELLRPAVRGALALSGGWVLLFCTAGDIAFAASPGKWILGIVIRTPSGGPAPVWRLTVRWAVKYSPVLILLGAASISEGVHVLDPSTPTRALDSVEDFAVFAAWVVILGSLLALFPAHRTLHDWIAGTAAFVNVEHEAPPRHGFEIEPVGVIPTQPMPPQPVPPTAPAPSDYPS